MSETGSGFGGWLEGLFARRPLRPPVDPEHPIEASLEDAELLLAFAVQSRRSLKEELVAKLTKAIENARSASAGGAIINAEDRAKFLFAYDELACAMAPLSAHSIRASMAINEKPFPASLLTPTAMLAAAAIAVFFFCMGVQSFWVAGKELLSQADTMESDRVKLQKQLAISLAEARRTDNKINALGRQSCDKNPAQCEAGLAVAGKGPRAKPPPPDLAELARVKAQQEALRTDVDEKSLVSESLSSELTDLNAQGKPLRDLLQQWYDRARKLCDLNVYTQFLCPVNKGKDENELVRFHDELALADANLEKFRRPAPSSAASAADAREAAQAPGGAPTSFARLLVEARMRDEERRNLQGIVADKRSAVANAEANYQRKTAHEVRLILSNLAAYIIPLAMGLLGSLAFILQSLSSQLRDHTYTPVSAGGSVVRLCLGAIAGVFGGMAAPGSDAVLKGLPPLFVPFVFGYGIEILFALLNRIIKTFTQADTAPSRSS